jgi:hypothetical protein
VHDEKLTANGTFGAVRSIERDRFDTSVRHLDAIYPVSFEHLHAEVSCAIKQGHIHFGPAKAESGVTMAEPRCRYGNAFSAWAEKPRPGDVFPSFCEKVTGEAEVFKMPKTLGRDELAAKFFTRESVAFDQCDL